MAAKETTNGVGRKKLGDVLIEAGLISWEQLRRALEIQAGGTHGGKGHKRLGKIMIELGFLTEEQMARALSIRLNLAFVKLGDLTIPDSAIQLVPRETAEREILIPTAISGRKLTVAVSDPLAWAVLDELRFRTGLTVSAVLATQSDILNAIERYYKVEDAAQGLLRLSEEFSDVEFVQPTNADAGEALQTQTAPIIRLVTMTIMDAVKRRATDVHIEPQEGYVQVRYRIDGNLQQAFKLPKRISGSVVSRIKIISKLDIANHLTPQDGSTRLRHEGREYDLRVSTLPSVHGEKVVIRILDRSRSLTPLPHLGIPDAIVQQVQTLVSRAQGMLVVTGPTGSGKTTTLYALLQWLSDPALNILTVEDPVEYQLPGITQVSVNEQAGLTFPSFLRSALRQDPDVILVGEVRDRETAEIAVQVSLTGHLVLTTLHTNDSVSTVTRLLDLGVPPFLVSSAISGVLAQRLVRKICEHCKVEVDPATEELPSWVPPVRHVYKGRGCDQCAFTGFLGQIGVYEYLAVSNPIKRLIASSASEAAIREEAARAGTRWLFDDAWQKVVGGVTTVSEVLGRVPIGYADSGGEPRALAAPAESSSDEEKPVILVLDDDEDQFHLLQSTFASRNYRVETLAPGADPYEAVCRRTPEAIVINLGAPQLGGAVLMEKLKGNLGTAAIPVVLLGHSADERTRFAVTHSGPSHLGTRQLQELLLVSRLEEALHGTL